MTDIIKTIDDKRLFGPWFRDRKSWLAWRSILKAIFALKLTPQENKIFETLSGGAQPPTNQVDECWIVAGRRAGKSLTAALIGTFLAVFKDYSAYVQPGENVTILILACDKSQARIVFNYVRGFFSKIPMLQSLIKREGIETLELTTGIIIEIHANSFRSVRGKTIAAAILDETAYWRNESSATPDIEVYNAILPGMASIPGSFLIGISSPYRRSGLLYEKFRDHFGQTDDGILVIKGTSQELNPSLPDKVVKNAMARDPVSAASEYLAEFRSDIAGFLLDSWIDAAISEGRHELPPVAGINYHIFTDPSGGARDLFTLGICHLEKGRLILDLCRGRKPPFDPTTVVKEYADIIKSYGCHRVTGDRYAGAWVSESFTKHEIIYEPTTKNKSEIYLSVEPLFAQGAIEILDNQKLVLELRQLERKTQSGGKDRVDHPPRGFDDLANSALGAIYLCQRNSYGTSDAKIEIARRPTMMGGESVDLGFDDESSDMPWISRSDTVKPWDF